MSLPGVDRTAACALIGEIGVDVSRFESSRHLASWAGLCPGNNESAGKRRSGNSHRGNRWIKSVMTEIAWAASHKKKSYSGASELGPDYYDCLNRRQLEPSLIRRLQFGPLHEPRRPDPENLRVQLTVLHPRNSRIMSPLGACHPLPKRGSPIETARPRSG